VLETPPEIVKMKIDYLVSFCDKSQNLWTIFLKNFGEYLRKTFPSEKLSVQVISYMTSAVWRMLDIIKIYFEILAKMAEENRKMSFLYNISIVQTSSSDNQNLPTFVYDVYHSNTHNHAQFIHSRQNNNIVNINIGANGDTDNELTDEFTRNFFNGTSPNMSCLHQESDYGKELNNNNEIINIILTNSHIILFQWFVKLSLFF
ncbi:12520_t:CDS:2, partial [Entrophospora sp. SA101]